MDNVVNIGKIIKRYRLNLGITLEKLADNLNTIYPDEKFTKGKISKWERDAETPKVTSLKRLADYYGTTVDQILSDAYSDEDHKNRIKDAKYKETLINTLHNLGYEFNEDAFNFGDFIVERLKITDTQLGVTYEVDPEELYDGMEVTFSTINRLQKQSNAQIETREIRNTLQKLNLNEMLAKDSTGLYEVTVTEKAAAGVGYVYGNNETAPYYTDRVSLQPHDFATLVIGDSMEPVYKDGDVALIKSGYDNVNGGIYLIDYDGKSYIKKLYNDGDRFRLVSINRDYDTIIIEIPPGDSIYFNIIGKVVDSFTPIIK